MSLTDTLERSFFVTLGVFATPWGSRWLGSSPSSTDQRETTSAEVADRAEGGQDRTVPVQVTLPESLLEWIDAEAEERQLSRSEAITRRLNAARQRSRRK